MVSFINELPTLRQLGPNTSTVGELDPPARTSHGILVRQTTAWQVSADHPFIVGGFGDLSERRWGTKKGRQ